MILLFSSNLENNNVSKAGFFSTIILLHPSFKKYWPCDFSYYFTYFRLYLKLKKSWIAILCILLTPITVCYRLNEAKITKTSFAFINVQQKERKISLFTTLSALSLLTPGKWLCNALSVFQCELSLTALFRIPILIHCHAVFKRLMDGKSHKNFYHISGAQKRNISGGILTSLTKRHFRRSPAMHSVLHWLIFPRSQLKGGFFFFFLNTPHQYYCSL